MSQESVAEPFRLELPVEAKTASADASGNPWKISGRLFRIARDQLLARVIIPTRDEVLKEAARAFDVYVAPINVPFIPDAQEPAFDETMKQAWLISVGIMYDQVAARLGKLV